MNSLSFNKKNLFFIFSYFGVSALYFYVALNSFGYDDEFHNINFIEGRSLGALLEYLFFQSEHHPIGQYLVNYFLFGLFNDWSFVRAFNALIFSLSLWILWLIFFNRYSKQVLIFSFIVICLNPSLLLWGTSLRWYVYLIPLLNFLTILCFVNPKPPRIFWGLFFFISLLACYVNYIALLVVPIFFLFSLINRKNFLKQDLPTIIFSFLISCLIYSYQIIILLGRQIHNFSDQTSNFLSSFTGLGFHLLNGHAVIPGSIASILFIVSNLILLIGIIHFREKIFKEFNLKVLSLSLVLVFIFKLTAKFRNLIVFQPLIGLVQSKVFLLFPFKLKIFLLATFLTASLFGIKNVVLHENTSKQSWNTPYSHVLFSINSIVKEKGCTKSQLITHDPVFDWHLKKDYSEVIFINDSRPSHTNWEFLVNEFEGCQIFLKTYKGSLSDNLYSSYLKTIEGLPKSREILLFKEDEFINFKTFLDPNIPHYYVELIFLDKANL